MSKNRSKWAISFVLVLAFCTSLYAQKRQWVYSETLMWMACKTMTASKSAGRREPIVRSSCGSVVARLILSA